MRIPHVRLGATALCLYPINSYNSTTTIANYNHDLTIKNCDQAFLENILRFKKAKKS